jgi:hypothetical protein
MNQNTFLRDSDAMIIITITKSGLTFAKPLPSPSEEDVDKLPSLTMKDVDFRLANDCWVNEVGGECTLQSINKSSTDEYLNCSSMDCTGFDPDQPDTIKKLKTKLCKVRSQEIQMNFPCIVSNIGNRRIMVQSTA